MRRDKRLIAFEVRRGRLERHVQLNDGRSYTHHCSLDVLQHVAHLVEASRGDGVTTNGLWEALPELPYTQVSVALAFLKEYGCVATEGRRSYAASTFVCEDAMIEFHYLAHIAAGGRDSQD